MNKFEQILKEHAQVIKLKKLVQNEGSVSWRCPSNIAIVKYWGKYADQIPANASLSLTLSKSVSKTQIDFSYSEKNNEPLLEFTFQGRTQAEFTSRISKYLNSIVSYMPWLQNTDLVIRSENTFPHSSGIASSASALSALAIGICNIEEILYGSSDPESFKKKASFLARLGSGSASRSVYGKMAAWGHTSAWSESSDEYAIPLTCIHENYMGMKDSILIIESGQKEVSSSLGHDLMKTNPYAKIRFEAAEENMQKLSSVLKSGDLRQFIDIMENEALSLHAMMMTSSPGFILMKPNTLEAIQRIRKYRNSTGKSIGFTLDAGANVHILYPESQAQSSITFIESTLKELCENKLIIHDEMGDGPEEMGNDGMMERWKDGIWE
jgi:diphosphomevalonate decarboxylase